MSSMNTIYTLQSRSEYTNSADVVDATHVHTAHTAQNTMLGANMTRLKNSEHVNEMSTTDAEQIATQERIPESIVRVTRNEQDVQDIPAFAFNVKTKAQRQHLVNAMREDLTQEQFDALGADSFVALANVYATHHTDAATRKIAERYCSNYANSFVMHNEAKFQRNFIVDDLKAYKTQTPKQTRKTRKRSNDDAVAAMQQQLDANKQELSEMKALLAQAIEALNK